jgi:hypothetical protein
MKITRAVSIVFALVLFLCMAFANKSAVKAPSPVKPAAPATIALKHEIIGTWRLVSRTVHQADGSESFDPKYGPHPVGYITYDRTGHMSVQFMRPDRPKGVTIDGYEAYFGTYTVDEQKHILTHHVEGHMLPDRVGQDFPRGLEVNGDELTLIIRNGKSPEGKPVTNFNRFTRMK